MAELMMIREQVGVLNAEVVNVTSDIAAFNIKLDSAVRPDFVDLYGSELRSKHDLLKALLEQRGALLALLAQIVRATGGGRGAGGPWLHAGDDTSDSQGARSEPGVGGQWRIFVPAC
mmetsp:Transcript_9374/g.16594  ORF Transcript_9374/g.16594 Transcript_9374/m.16594 type:complete len:117 (-) Transcript_9374:953-1303(-)